MKQFILLVIISLTFHLGFSQDLNYTRTVIDTLTSASMHGRGYINKGDKIAASFIANEFESIGLNKFKKSYFQHFNLSVNTFPANTKVRLNTTDLLPGSDFLIAPGSSSCKGVYDVVTINKRLIDDSKELEKFKDIDFTDKFVVIDDEGINSKEEKIALNMLSFNPFKAKGIIVLTEKLTWSVSQQTVKYVLLHVLKNSLPDSLATICIDIENKFIKNHKTQNVIGFIPGNEKPDSFIVYTAHYDHLGQMGEVVFPGANDNASGTAMLLDLARIYTKKPSKYSIVFMAFAAEEAGLHGSEFYTNNPIFPLSSIKFLINLDLMSNGDEGITVVNGTEFEKEFHLLNEINKEKNLVPIINKRGKAANSDHYHFSEKGVKAFFIYTLGGGKAYHDIYDTPEKLTHPRYNELIWLLTTFVEKL